MAEKCEFVAGIENWELVINVESWDYATSGLKRDAMPIVEVSG